MEETARLFLDNIVRSYGIPRQIAHDRDPRFTSLFWKALFEILGSKLLYRSAYHPQTNGQTEQMNIVVEQILRAISTDVDAKWVSKLNFVEFAINLSVSASTGKIPFELVYGQQVQNVVDQLDGLHHIESAQYMVNNFLKFMEEAKTKLYQAQESQAKQHDHCHRPVEFMVNNIVLLSIKKLQLSGTQKFQQHFVRPLTVIEHISSQVYRLQLPAALQQFYNIFQVSLLKPYIAGGDGVEQLQPIIIHGELEQKVEIILQHRCHHGTQYYLVKYVGYDQSEAMWLDESDLMNVPNILADYQARMG